VLLVAVVCGGALWVARWWRTSRNLDASGMLQCCHRIAPRMSISISGAAAKRAADLIAGSTTQEEPDYNSLCSQPVPITARIWMQWRLRF